MPKPTRLLILGHHDQSPSGPGSYITGLRSCLDPAQYSFSALDTSEVEHAIRDQKPDIVFGLPSYDLQHMHLLVPYYPKIAFVMRTLTNWTIAQGNHELPILLDWFRTVTKCPNAYISANSAIVHRSLPAMPRIVRTPNVYPYPILPPSVRSQEPYRLAFVSRAHWAKQLPVAIVATRILQQSFPVEFHIWSDTHPSQARYMRQLNWTSQLQPAAVWHPLTSNACELRNELRRLQISAVLMPTLSDSYGYAGADAISAGVPVVGTDALDYLFPPWQCARPTDPHAFAETALQAITANSATITAAQDYLQSHTDAAKAATIRTFAEIAETTLPDRPNVDANNWRYVRIGRTGRLR